MTLDTFTPRLVSSSAIVSGRNFRALFSMLLAALFALLTMPAAQAQTVIFNGQQTTVAGVSAMGVAVDSRGNVYVAADGSGTVYKYAPNGSGGYTQTTVASGLNIAQAVAVDGSGNVYVVDNAGAAVYKYAPNGSGGYTQTTVASKFGQSRGRCGGHQRKRLCRG